MREVTLAPESACFQTRAAKTMLWYHVWLVLSHSRHRQTLASEDASAPSLYS